MKKIFGLLAILVLAGVVFSQEISFSHKPKEDNHLCFRLNSGVFLNIGVFKKILLQQEDDSVGFMMAGRLADTVVVKAAGKFKYIVRPENKYISVATIRFPGDEIVHLISFPGNSGTIYFNICLPEENYYLGKSVLINSIKYKKQNRSAEISRR